MEELVKIKCPSCGKVFIVKSVPGIENASVTCPVCKRKASFMLYQKVVEKSSEDTEIGCLGNAVMGCIKEKTGMLWQLHAGVNTIGRKLKTPPQQVDVPLSDYTGEKKMSRHHAKVEVVRQPNGNCKHVLYNWENKNPTRVDGKMVEFGDRIILHNGMVLSFANIDVEFVIEDSEETTT